MQAESFEFNPLSPEFQANPYDYYQAIRQFMPQLHYAEWNTWFLTRHNDCSAVLKDQRFGHEILKIATREELGWGDVPEDQRAVSAVFQSWMLNRDPPDHTRLRSLVHKAFTPRMVERLRDKAQSLTDAAINQLLDEREADLIELLAMPIPVTIIAELLGVPANDQDAFRGWSRALAGSLEMTQEPEVYRQASRAADEFNAYFRELIAEKQRHPREDLLSALAAVDAEGDRLSEEETLAMCILLLVAGHETTVNLIGNGTLALLRNPDQFALFAAHPAGLAKTAVEEFIRYDGPVQLTSRFALEDGELNGMNFHKGQEIVTIIGAANRDPEKFENPESLDITRTDNPHLGFGAGIHYCLGSPLARLEGQIVFATLAERVPNLQLAVSDPARRKTYVLRGLAELPVRV